MGVDDASTPVLSETFAKSSVIKHGKVENATVNNGKYNNFWSRIVFKWFTPILILGNEKSSLDPEDLDLVPLPQDCSAGVVHAEFERYWKQEVIKNSSNPSLVKVLAFSFGREYFYAGILKFVHDIFLFVGPQVLREMILYLGEDVAGGATMRRGLMLTGAVVISQIIMSLCLRHYFYKCYSTGLRVRSAVVVSVYQKVLSLSSNERQHKTLGEITNLMSIDAQRLQDWMPYLHSMWSSPLQIGIAMSFLWRLLGPSCLGGVTVILIMIPVTKLLSDWMGLIQKKLMNAKDKRVELNGEVLSNMKIVKFQAWEESFQNKITNLRSIELEHLWRYFIGKSISEGMWVLTPLLVSLCTFTPYVLSGHTLDVATALTALALFEILRFPLFMLPMVISSVIETKVSIDRLKSFLLCDDFEDVSEGTLSRHGVDLVDITASYGRRGNASLSKKQSSSSEEGLASIDDEKLETSPLLAGKEGYNTLDDSNTQVLCLKGLNFTCQPGDLIAIVGSVGSGKSSVINTILGEIKQLSGQTSVKGKLAYFSQNPFIMNASLRNNILFGHLNEHVDEDLYQRCLDSCALKHDLNLFSFGDRTEIGERGITLSGGQKARVALARAVYHQADITLIDDVLAAVDSHVSKHLFENAIVGELLTQDHSVILVTNALQYLHHPRVNKIYVIEDGRLLEYGTYHDLVAKSDSAFSRMMSVLEKSDGGQAERSDAKATVDQVAVGNDNFDSDQSGTREQTKDSKLAAEEVREKGHVKADVYLAWAKSAGGFIAPAVMITLFFVFESTSILSNWWLTYWSAHGDSGRSQTYFLIIYAMINVTAAILDFLRSLSVGYFSLLASRKLFQEMLGVVLFAKMSFFDTTPIGRLVNRFSKDVYSIDEDLTGAVINYCETMFKVLSTIVVISVITPFFTICLIPIIIFYLSEQSVFILPYRELKRLDSVARSPIFALLGESVDGVAVIRAFLAQETLRSRMISMLDKQQHAYFLTFVGQSWLGIRLELAGTFIIGFACMTAVIQHVVYETNTNYAGLAGLSISYALSVTQSLAWTVRQASDLEANMVAVERVREYTNLETEGIRTYKTDDDLVAAWPTLGEIEFQNVQMRYRPELPLVLNGLNIHIPAGSKVGVVGRTGAGKSSLMVALLRLVELTNGKILIDKTDVKTLGLAKLRQNIAVIPQDPILFRGTIRTNLDPFDEYTDDALYEVLEHVGLYKYRAISSSSSSLKSLSNVRVNSIDDEITEGGSNFSNGQRQLIVIARALLRDQKVVISDEATASIDNETDDVIQKVLRTKFVNATCITIAHRLNTIMDSDYILVMHDGKAAEFDTPKNLLQKGGMFRDLVDASRRD